MVEKVFTGPIQRQLKDALAYLKNYILKEAVIKESDKAEATRVTNYPYAAVEEILSNAVYHRSYQINEPKTVRITKDGMEITSFLGFDRSITEKDIETVKIRARAYRNRRIGDFLKEIKQIEGRNTGYPNALKALKENGSDSLKFQMDGERSYLSVTIPVHSYFAVKKVVDKKVLDYREKIKTVLTQELLTKSELATQMGYKGISAKLAATVDEMVKDGTIESVAIDSRIKYRVVK